MFAKTLIAALAFTGTLAVKVQEDLGQHGLINLAQFGHFNQQYGQSQRPDEQAAYREC